MKPTLTRPAKRVVLAVLASMIPVLLCTQGAAQASVLSSTGAPGTAAVRNGACYNQDAWGTVTIRENPPAIYARNSTYGAGNDGAWVRWRTVLFDEFGNQTSAGWSDFSYAYDNTPAAYSGQQVFSNLSARGTYHLRMEIQWWNSTTKLGATWNSVDYFDYYRGGAYYGRVASVCLYL